MKRNIYLGRSTTPADNEQVLYALKRFDDYMRQCIDTDFKPNNEEYVAGYIDGIYNCICQFNKMFNF